MDINERLALLEKLAEVLLPEFRWVQTRTPVWCFTEEDKVERVKYGFCALPKNPEASPSPDGEPVLMPHKETV